MRTWTSDLEREFELEFGDISVTDRLGELEDADEEFEGFDDQETVDDEEFQLDEELEFEAYGASSDKYVDRFMELASQSYESELELDESVERLLGEMEREYFWGALKKVARRGLRAGVGKLISQAKHLAKSHPLYRSLQGLTSLHRRGLRGLLGQLASAAASATPYGGAINAAMKAPNFQPGAPQQEREAWENFVNVSKDAYQNLAANISETESIGGAQDQAARALSDAISKHRGNVSGSRGDGRRIIRLRPGEKVTIVCTP